MQIETNSPFQTRALGQALGKRLYPGSVVALFGDLGSGKTCFSQGIALGLDVPKDIPVTSPTYTFINEYPGRLTLYHMDLYRIKNPGDLDEIGFYECVEGHGASVIEWACRLHKNDLAGHVRVDFSTPGKSRRELSLTGSGQKAIDLVNALELELKKTKGFL